MSISTLIIILFLTRVAFPVMGVRRRLSPTTTEVRSPPERMLLLLVLLLLLLVVLSVFRLQEALRVHHTLPLRLIFLLQLEKMFVPRVPVRPHMVLHHAMLMLLLRLVLVLRQMPLTLLPLRILLLLLMMLLLMLLP